MGVFARMKSGVGNGSRITELAQVAAPPLPANRSVFTVTGTTAITGFSTANPILPGREVCLMGTHATGPAFTDTAVASTANGAIHLSAALTLANGTNVTFRQANNGSFHETARSVCG